MKNLLAKDRSVKVVCKEVLRGSYPIIAKQFANQLLLALCEIKDLKSRRKLRSKKEK
jgi:hypothetical protein